MSLNEWKNKELFDLLSQKWGFSKNVITEAKGEKGDADPLDGERAKFDKDHDGVPDGADKDKDDPEIQEDLNEGEEQLDEEEIEEIAAKRFGNEDRDVGRNRMHADRMHEVVKRFKKLIK
jgi:hypothetical protein